MTKQTAVHAFEVWDIAQGKSIRQAFKATLDAISKIPGAKPIPGTEEATTDAALDGNGFLKDGSRANQ